MTLPQPLATLPPEPYSSLIIPPSAFFLRPTLPLQYLEAQIFAYAEGYTANFFLAAALPAGQSLAI
jgi:hypothetical protein